MLDARLRLERVADAPRIVTPTAITFDTSGALLVVECHTHMRPEGYDGPPADRILRFENLGDLPNLRVSDYFQGTTATMGLAAGPDGWIYVATRSEIFRIRDADGNGISDTREPLAELRTTETYPHNGLSGFAFDFDGTVYFGLGENLSADYELVSASGESIRGGGEGGSVFRIAPDGSTLARVAVGFWNPFHLCTDAYGQLFAADNDPDWRPPCRLLHVVPGGDYGYRRRYGRRGTHPFSGWFGEVPGTLGMVAGTGEAPSGLVSYDSDGLPQDYHAALLGTSWGHHAIERFRLKRRGATYEAVAEPIVQGGEDFRPVCLAIAPDGSVYFSDWVDRSYTLHKQGRIWRLHSGESLSPDTPRPRDDKQAIVSVHRPLRESAARNLAAEEGGAETLRQVFMTHGQAEVRAAALLGLIASGAAADTWLATARLDPSPEVRALAAARLPEASVDASGEGFAADESPLVRAAALRGTRADTGRIPGFHDKAGNVPAARVSGLQELQEETGKRSATERPAERSGITEAAIEALGSTDAFLRQAARYALDERIPLERLRDLALAGDPLRRLEATLLLRSSGDGRAAALLPRLLGDSDRRVRLAAVQWVGEERLEPLRGKLEVMLHSAPLDERLMQAILASIGLLDGQDQADFEQNPLDSLSRLINQGDPHPVVLEFALRSLAPGHASLPWRRLKSLLEHTDNRVRLAAIRRVRDESHTQRAATLAQVAQDTARPPRERAEAVVGLSADEASARNLLVRLATAEGKDDVVREEALRSLQGVDLTPAERASIADAGAGHPRLAPMIARLLDPHWDPAFHRPAETDLGAWEAWLEEGDASSGARVFFHPRGPKCHACHAMRGAGGRIAPDLATMAELPLSRLLDSILMPSREVAPHYVTWSIETSAGKVLSLLPLTEEADDIEVYADGEGNLVRLHPREIVARKPQAVSVMPEGLFRRLTDDEIRDLMSLLRRGDH